MNKTEVAAEGIPMDSISNHLEKLAQQARANGGLSVGEIIHTLGQDSIVLALVMFTLLSSLPLFSIPGFTTLTGIPIILLGGQLLFAAHEVWMPKRLEQRQLKSKKIWHFIERSIPVLQAVERHLKPRLLFMTMVPMRHVLGAAFVVMGILLALPIPFINFPAGFSMFILALGLMERDGVIVIIGLICIGLILSGMGYAGYALGEGLKTITD